MNDKIIHKILDVFFVLCVLAGFILGYRIFDFFLLRYIN